MRVLIVAAVAILAALTAWPGCYDPEVNDCVFTCGSNDSCPGDTSCHAGYCRTEGFTDTCGSGTGGDPCPAAQDGCMVVIDGDGSATTQSGGKFCLQDCAAPELDANAAAKSCGSGWHIAVLDTPEKLGAASKVLSGIYWIGLDRTDLSAPWTWITHSGTVSNTDPNWADPPNSGATFSCAAENGDHYYSELCTSKHAFACSN